MNKTSGRRGTFSRWCDRSGVWCGLMLIASLAAPHAAEASTYRWQVDADGDWNVPANWAVIEGPAGVGYPNLPGDVAIIGGPFTANRTVTIPDLVTVSIGRLEIQSVQPRSISIDRLGTGLLVFDNAVDDATIESAGDASLITPIQLGSNLVFTGNLTIHGGISETGGARNVTVASGSLFMGIGTNTYTGTTTVVSGSLHINPADPASIRIAGPLVVGDGIAANAAATAIVRPGSIASTSDVLIRRDGTVSFTRLGPGVIVSQIDELTVQDGTVNISGTSSQLEVGSATMQGGLISMQNPAQEFILLGTLTATSSATGPAIISTEALFPNNLMRLTAASHDLVVADGPQDPDLLIGTKIIGAAFGVNKQGPGAALFTSDNTYTGATTITAGTLLLNGTQQGSAVTVAGGRLGGSGIIGNVTANAGSVAPGALAPVAILTTRNVTLAAGVQYVADITGPVAGAGYDQLLVTGSVDLGGASLVLNTPAPLAPDAALTIISNDLNDPIAGTFASLPEGAIVTSNTGLLFQISYAGGSGNDVVLTNVTPVSYFLSEGATGTFFDEDVLIANPNPVAAPITMTFFLPGGGTIVQQRTVPAQSRITVKVDEIPGLEATSPSVRVSSDNRLTLAVERTMFWDSTHYGGHTANAVPQAERKWYFAEGATGFFDTYLLLGNASNVPIDVLVTYLRELDTPVTETVNLPAFSRVTVDTSTNPALENRSFGMTAEASLPFTAERAMYFASTPDQLWSGGHVNIGAAAPSTSWFHAEGASGSFFTTFILMSNPQDTPANVTLRFLLAEGVPVELTKTIPARQRLTINPAVEGGPTLQNAAFSTVVRSDVPIVSERAMYWPDPSGLGEGHASSGVVTTAANWALAEGRVGGPAGYTTYILLANPAFSSADVTVTFLRESGAPVIKTYTVGPNTRFNIDVGVMVPELQNESFGARIDVTSGAQIAVERSMYWNANGIFWAGGSNALAEVVPQ